MRTLLLTAAALSTPHAAKVLTSSVTEARQKQPSVSYTIDRIVAPLDPQSAYDDIVAEAAELYALDPHMIRAVMQAESAFHPFAVSRAGAEGLMQLMPELSDEIGVNNAFDPRENIMGGARYLKRLLDFHKGNIDLALASYNAGPGNVERYGGVPPFRETKNYVKTIKQILRDRKKRQASDAD